jgi:O-acetyl-ADP-ribose deacetylase (regulator of RNase III)
MTVSLVKNVTGHPTSLKIGDSTIHLLRNSDITKLGCDIIVNASKPSLENGGGINKAIHAAGGKEIDKGCKKFPEKKGVRCPTGETRMTGAGKMPAKLLCHTVAPDARKIDIKKAKGLLSNAYKNTLNESHKFLKSLIHKAKGHDVHELDSSKKEDLKKKMKDGKTISIAFPTLGTGIFKFPKKEGMKIALKEIVSYIDAHQGKKGIKEFNIVFCQGQQDLPFYEEGLQYHYDKKKK